MVDLQQTYRRLEPLHVGFALFWGLGMLVPVVAILWSAGPSLEVASVLAWDAAGVISIYLAAPAASIVVTPRHVIVRNPFRQFVVPRHLIEGVDTKTLLTPRLVVRGARSIRLAALNGNLPQGYENSGRHQRQSVTQMLARVPEEPNDGQVDRHTRYAHVVLAAATVAVTVAATRYLLEHS